MGYLIDQDVNRLVMEEAHLGIREMAEWGVDFYMKGGKFIRFLRREADKPGLPRDAK